MSIKLIKGGEDTLRPLSPHQILRMRRKDQESQRVFAFYLNVSRSLVSKWERGLVKPSGASLKLLTLVDKKGLDWVA